MLIRGLKDGTIDMIATDHAPHSREEKEKPLTEAPSGILGLETALALGITNLVKPGYPYHDRAHGKNEPEPGTSLSAFLRMLGGGTAWRFCDL